MQYIFILGRQAALSLAELESVFGASAVTPINNEAALVECETPNHQILGGTIKVGKLLDVIPGKSLNEAVRHFSASLPGLVAEIPEGKMTVGVSVYGHQVRPQAASAAALELKKIMRKAGRSVRAIQNTASALNSAQILHNKLLSATGIELLVVVQGNKLYLAQTTSVQDVDDYAKRDFARPKRDAWVGMLPPKLAQIMLNLAQVKADEAVLDPFCGTGVVLQEAALHGCKLQGTDLQSRMIEFTAKNLEWLQKTYHISPEVINLEAGDARTHLWQQPIQHAVCETYLGKPLKTLPPRGELDKIRRECSDLIKEFLLNLHRQTTSGTRSTIAIPAWFAGRNFLHLPVIDQIEEIGYNYVSFKHVSTADLIYHREDQLVARELLVLIRK